MITTGWPRAGSTPCRPERRFTGEEYRFQRPDGSVAWVSGNAVALRGSDGEIAGYLGTCEDITERKRAQEGLERDARSFDISRDLLIEVRFDGGVLERVNSASMAILGWRPEEMIGQPYTNFVHPDDAGLSEGEVARLAAGGITIEFRNRYRTPEGAWRWLEWNAIGVPEEGRLYAAARDITERLELEAELQREHRQLEDAQAGLKEAEAIARLGSWDWDVAADSVTWSDGMHALYGTDAENFAATLAAMVEPIHPDDRRRTQEAARAAVVDGLPYEIEYRLLRADGELRWHSGHGRPQLGPDGNVVRIVGTLQDVTERKQAELLLQASELRYRSVGENLPSTSVLMFDSELRCIAAMGGALGRHGRTAGELIGRRFDELAADPKAAGPAWGASSCGARGRDAPLGGSVERRSCHLRPPGGPASRWRGRCGGGDSRQLRHQRPQANGAGAGALERRARALRIRGFA